MKTHYSEVDMLELYYIPGGMVPAIRHLEECSDCSARYASLHRKLRSAGSASCDRILAKPDTFWVRQRMAIMRTVQKQSIQKPGSYRLPALRAAAVIVLLLGAGLFFQPAERPGAVSAALPAAEALDGGSLASEEAGASDPWASEELADFESTVAWEQWLPEADQKRGTL